MDDMYQPFTPKQDYLAVALIAIPLLAILTVLSAYLLKRYLRLTREYSYLLSVVTVAAATGAGLWRWWSVHRELGSLFHSFHVPDLVGPALCAGGAVLLGAPLLLWIYRGWLGLLPLPTRGQEALQAWLSPLNLVLVLASAYCGHQGFGLHFWGALTVLLALLFIAPALSLLQNPPLPAPSPEDARAHNQERDKVLSMLESGRITPEESLELLNALNIGANPSIPSSSERSSAPSRLSLVQLGAAVVLIGFFLPWFTVDLQKEALRLSQQMQGTMGLPAMPQVEGPALSFPSLNGNFSLPGASTGSPTLMRLSGGDVKNGVGWMILGLSIAAAIVPLLSLARDQARMITILCLCGGLVLLAYVSIEGFRYISVGPGLAAIGLLLQFRGIVSGRAREAGAIGSALPA